MARCSAWLEEALGSNPPRVSTTQRPTAGQRDAGLSLAPQYTSSAERDCVACVGTVRPCVCAQNGGRDGEGKLHRHFVERVGGRDNWHARAQTRMWWAINATGRPMPMLFMGDEFLQTGFWHCGDNKHEWMQVREFVCDASSATRRGCSYGWNLKRMRRRHGECIRKIKQSQGMGNLCPNRQEYISTRSVRSVRSLAPFTETLWCELMWI